MIQLIIGIIIAVLVVFYLFLRKSLQKENLPAMNAPNPLAVSEDINLPAGQAGLPVKSEDINLPIENSKRITHNE